MRTIPGIGLLRMIAAGAVLIAHVTYWTGATNVDTVGRLMSRGDAGVAIFFAISAFLLTFPAATCAQESPRAYAIKRVGRIMPAYLVALLAVVLASLWIDGTAGGIDKILAHLTLVQGYTSDEYRGFSQTWSLTTEATFYVLVPFLRPWLRRCVAARKGPWPALGAASVISVGIQAASASSGNHRLGIVSTSVAGHALWFSIGIGLAYLVAIGCPLPRAGTCLAWTTALYALAATPLAGPMDLSTPTVAAAAVKEVFYGAIALGALGWGTTVSFGAVGRSWASALGDLSYGVFLWHVLVLQVLFHALHLRTFNAPFGLTLIAVATVTGLLSRLSWSFVERPAIRWAHRAAKRTG